MTRIGIIANTIDSIFGLRAGGNIHFLETARFYDGHELVVFAPAFAREWVATYLPNASFVTMPSCDRYSKSRIVVFLYRTLMTTLRVKQLRQCDVLLATSHFLPDVVPALLGGGKHAAATIWHLQDLPWKRPGSTVSNIISYINERISLTLIKRFMAGAIAGTTHIVDQVSLDSSNVKEIAVTTNGVPQVLEEGMADKLPRSGAVYVGRLHAAKGTDDLLRAWAVVHQSRPTDRLTIIGRGAEEYKFWLRQLALELGIGDAVSIVDDADDQMKIDALLTARLFVFPSKEEGWGIAIAEAMAAGLACVTYDLPVFAELFQSGRREVPLGEWEALGKVAVRLLNDSEELGKLSVEALELSKKFRWRYAAHEELRVLTAVSRAAG